MARVEPRLVQSGAQIIDSASRQPVYLRGFGTEVSSQTTKTLMEQTFGLLPGANACSIRFTQSTGEPNHPTGSAPSWVHTWDTTIFTRGVAMMQWCEDNHRYFVVRTGHHGADGSSFLGGSSGTPNWFYDSSLWGAGTAPLPADRAGYGGDYSSAFAYDVDSASWVPLAGDSGLSDPGHKVRGKATLGSGKTWGGDADALYYLYGDWYQHLVEVSQVFTYCLGYNFFNEPDIGALNDANNFNEGSTHIKSVERMIKTQALIYDRLRAIEPTRWFSTHGEGGPNWTQSPNFAYYWDPAGLVTVCPSDHNFAHEAHFYMSGQAGYSATPGNYDTTATGFNQNSLNNVQTVFQIDLPGIVGTNSFSLKLPGASSGSPTATFVRGTNLTAAAIQTALRAVQVGGVAWDAALTVTGTTDAGPFIVTLPTATSNTKRLQISTFSPQVYGGFLPDVSYPDNFAGKLNDKDCYSPQGTIVTDSVRKVHDKMTARGIPLIVGEYGIDEDVFNADQYYTDIDTALRVGFDHSFNFVANVGDSDGILDEFSSNVYTLNHLGARLNTLLSQAYTPSITIVGTFDLANAATSGAVNLPAGTQAGDMVVLFASARSSGTTGGFTFVPSASYAPIPVGVPQGSDHDGQFLTAGVYTKLLSANEISVSMEGMGSVSNILCGLVIRGVASLDQASIDASPNLAGTTPVAPSITTTSDGCPLVFLAAQSQASTVVTEVPGFTQQLHDREAVVGGNLCAHIATSSQAIKGATGSKSLILSGSGRWVAALLSFTPSGGGGGTGQTVPFKKGMCEGHIEGWSQSDQHKAAGLVRMVCGQDGFQRTDCNQTGSGAVTDTFGASYWSSTKATTLRNCQELNAVGCDPLYTLHLTSSNPVPGKKTVSGQVTMPSWEDFCRGFCDAAMPRLPSYTSPRNIANWGLSRPIWGIEFLNEPNGNASGHISAADAWLMIKLGAKVIRAHAAANGYTVHLSGPALAGNPQGSGVVDPFPYMQQLHDAAVADGGTLRSHGGVTILDGVTTHVYMSDLVSAGASTGTNTSAIQDAKRLQDYIETLDASYSALDMNITEGGYSGDDTQNRWVGPSFSGPPNVEYLAKATVDGLAPAAGKWAADEQIGLAIDELATEVNAGTLRMHHCAFFKLWRETTPYAGPADAYDHPYWQARLGAATKSSGTEQLQSDLSPIGVAMQTHYGQQAQSPVVTFTSPLNGTTITGTSLQVTASATSASGIATMEYQLDGGAWTSLPSQGGGIYSATVTVSASAAPGTSHTVRVRATDSSASHLVTTSPLVTIHAQSNPVVDATPPTLNVTSPPGDVTLTLVDDQGTYTIAGSATDAGSGIQSVTVNGSSVSLDGSGNFLLGVPIVKGPNPVVVVARDNAPTPNQTTVTRVITVVDPVTVDYVIISDDQNRLGLRLKQRGVQ